MHFIAAVCMTTMVLVFFLTPQLTHSKRNEDQTWVARKMLADVRREWVSIKNRIGELEARVTDIAGSRMPVLPKDDDTTVTWTVPHDAIDDALLYDQNYEPLSISQDAYGDFTTECDPERTPIATFLKTSETVRRTLTQYSKHLSSRAWALAVSVVARN
jgi:hypothetical protein